MLEFGRVSAGVGYERLEAKDGAKDVCGDRLLSSLVRTERPPYDRMGETSCFSGSDFSSARVPPTSAMDSDMLVKDSMESWRRSISS